MKYRIPIIRNASDFVYFLIISVLLPIVLLFDVIVVLPEIHEPDSFPYDFTIIMALLIYFNIHGNMIACMIIATSVKFETVREPSAADAERLEWRHCKTCDRFAPPRSWHCRYCGVCILKRDHHCGFMGCCIGHHNHRYFVCFVFYLFVGAIYALVYNTLYIVVFTDGVANCWKNALVVRFPAHIPSCSFWVNVQIIIFGLNIFTLICASMALIQQVSIVLRGAVSAECGRHPKYNCGIYHNLRSVFGVRMHLAWICPLIESRLPSDGYSWKCISNKDLK
ncbi:probable palmitoyltransferase ZDHHC24 [Drosophila grimshawi]|uniref:Palmitoyltransferase n=1 Tax=Drosophila grimshawi TaxID=7222 RepID=B4J8N6_DROGR|nr:probable palmitoyltransferase ZDHHC24 [Drosophila grimshawi]EDW01303.1 GH20532 [Drosophila grimshawi]